MAKPSNPLGTSTGLGKGEAQVFGDTYSSFFKDKLAQAEKKDKELKDAMAKASDMSQLWSRDVAAFKPMVNEYQNFVRENARALIKGDFDATVKNQQMMNNLTQFASSSKEAQKFYNESLKAMRNHPNMYYDKDEAKLMDFGSSAYSGDFDYSKYGLRPKMDVTKITDNLKADVQKFGTIPGGLNFVEQKNASGEVVARYLVDRKGNKRADLNELVDNAIINSKRDFGEPQASEKLDDEWRESTIKQLKNYLIDERIIKNTGMGSPDSSGGTPETRSFPFSSNATLVNMPVAYGVKEKGGIGGRTEEQLKGVLAYNNGDVNTYNPISYEASIVHRGKPSTQAIPIKGDFIRKMLNQNVDHYIDDNNEYIGGIAESGMDFYYEDLKKGIKEADWKIQTSYMIDAFPEGYISSQGVNLSGMPVDTASIATDEFKKKAPKGAVKRYYVALKESGTGEGNQRVLDPYYLHHDNIVQQYESSSKKKEKYLEWYNKTKQSLIDNGYSQAYKDFTNQEMPSSSKTETKEEKTQLPESVIQNWLKKNKLTDTKANRDKAIKSYEEYKKTKNQKTKQN